MTAIDQTGATPAKPSIFISYTSRDRNWAYWIAVTLRDSGHKPFVHEWEVGAGENIARWMEERIGHRGSIAWRVHRCLYQGGVFRFRARRGVLERSGRSKGLFGSGRGRARYPLAPSDAGSQTPVAGGLSEAEAERALPEFLVPPSAPLTAAWPGPPGAIIVAKNELRACYVAPAATRRGVGTALVRELERIALEHGLECLALDA
jgi:GNAT superfamily N-acetyltransferase